MLFLCLYCLCFSQTDSVKIKKADEIKTGWNFGALPMIAYNSDLGLQYGALFSPFYYGDGSQYPKYLHKMYAEISRFTKGSGVYRFYYNSEYVIPNVNLIADASYLTDDAYDFYGFNGNQTKYNASWIDKESDDYVSTLFYDTQRKQIKAKAEFQGKTKLENFSWAAGILFRSTKFSQPDFDNINEGKDPEDILASDSTLFDKYVEWDLIPQADKDGGIVTSIKLGLVYDTRDFKANPYKGAWTEASVVISPSFLGTTKTFVRLNITHRQYFTIFPDKVNLACRLVCQSNIFGDTPFYIMPEIETSVMSSSKNEGLGGEANLRGATRNRVVGKTVAFGNFELRWKIVKFIVAKQNIYIGTNVFFDTGAILAPLDMDLSKVPESSKDLYFTDEAYGFHSTYGIGLKLAMNENFILSLDRGYAASKHDGDKGTYIRMDYLF